MDLSQSDQDLQASFPGFPGKAVATEVTLNAGQMLYLPAGEWCVCVCVYMCIVKMLYLPAGGWCVCVCVYMCIGKMLYLPAGEWCVCVCVYMCIGKMLYLPAGEWCVYVCVYVYRANAILTSR